MGGLRVLWLSMLLAGMVSLSMQVTTLTISADSDICRLVTDGTILRMPGYCNRKVRCENSRSVEIEPCKISESYSLVKKTCGKLERADSYCSDIPCKRTSDGYVQDFKNCQGWYFCDGKTSLGNGLCTSNLYFDTKSGSCIYPETSKCVAEYELCDVMPEGIKIKDEYNCHQYFTCKNYKETLNVCADGTYFDLATGSCQRKSTVDCKQYPLPKDVCGTTKLAKRNRFVSDEATCRGYFYCRDLGSGVPDKSPSWGQCGLPYFFDERMERCVERYNAYCDEDRCDGRVSGRELSPVKGCQHYLECQNGAETSIVKCDNNMYFDVVTEQCVPEVKRYSACS